MLKTAAIIMAGGTSERMRAGGCKIHKALRQIGPDTLLSLNLQALVRFDFRDITVAVNAAEYDLRFWLDSQGREAAARDGVNLRILVEEQPRGTVGAARALLDIGENVLVINVDNLSDLNLRDLVTFHLAHRAACTVATHAEPFRIPFGQVETDGVRIVSIREKPEMPVLVSSGAYVLDRRAMLKIPERDKMHAPDLVNLLLKSNEPVAAFRHAAWWMDVNDEATLSRASAALCRRPLFAAAAGHA